MKLVFTLVLCFGMAACRVNPEADPLAFNNIVSLWDHFWTQYVSLLASTHLGTALKESYEAYQTLYGNRGDFSKTDRTTKMMAKQRHEDKQKV